MDGFASAYLAYNYYDDVEIHYCGYNEPFPVDPTGRDILIVDFSFPREQLLEIKEKASLLLVLDHHASAKHNLMGFDFCRFEDDECGTTMLLDYFIDNPSQKWKKFVAKKSFSAIDLFTSYVRDHDLWQFKLGGSKEIRLYFRSVEFDFDKWDLVIDQAFQHWFETGKVILKFQTRLVDSLVGHARPVTLADGTECMGVPCNLSELTSDVGHELAKISPSGIGCTWFEKPDGVRVYSLRSLEGVDALRVAKHYGGGGHKHACGFSVPVVH